MKITRIETTPVRVPLKPELAIRSGRGGSHTVSPFLIVRVHTDSEIIGLGEASCTPRWSGEDQTTAAHLIHHYLEPLLVGEDPCAVEGLYPRFRLAFAANYFTKAAVEMALWDIAGKAAGKPVYELLGGKKRESVKTKWSISGQAPEQAAAIAQNAFTQGFRAMKVKVGIEPRADVARVSAVRQAVGTSVKLGIDANGGWSRDQAIDCIQRLQQEEGIFFAEQPVPPEEIMDLVEVRRQAGLPIIADESLYTLQDARTLAALGAADVFSIYIGKAGGIGPASKIATFAQHAGIKCTLGSNLELGIGSAAMAHLAVASEAISADEFPCDIIGPFYYEEDIIKRGPRILPGLVTLSNDPGLGVELDEAALDRFKVG